MVPLATIVKAIHNKVARYQSGCSVLPVHRGLGLWFRISGLEFFGNNGLGASWDPTGRYSTMEPSVSTFRGSLKLSEVGLTVKKG